MSWRNFSDKVRRYTVFSLSELFEFVAMIVVFAFIYSFDKWGPGSQFNLGSGIQNYLYTIVLIASVVFVHNMAQRIVAVRNGFRAEHRLWWYGLLLGLLFVVVSNGKIWWLQLYFASGLYIHQLAVHRLGTFRYGPNIDTYAWIAACGPLANVLFAAAVKTLQFWSPFPLNAVVVDDLFVLNLWFAFLNLLPIPPLDGSRIFFASRLWYAFSFGTLAGYVLLIQLLDEFSFIYALIIGGIVWLGFYIFFEKEWTK